MHHFPEYKEEEVASLNRTSQVRMSLVKGRSIVRKCFSVVAALFRQL